MLNINSASITIRFLINKGDFTMSDFTENLFSSAIFGAASSAEELHALVRDYSATPDEHAARCKSLLDGGESLKLGDIIVDATLRIKALLYLEYANALDERTLQKCAVLSTLKSIEVVKEIAKELTEMDESYRSNFVKRFNEQLRPTVEADTTISELFKRISKK
jgi:hypothetical protein